MNKTNWIAVAAIAVLGVIIFQAGVTLGNGRETTGWGMMGPGMMGGWGFSPLGGIGMLFMWIVPVGLFVLAITGGVWLVRTLSGNNGAAGNCPSCSRSVQPDWRHCPHCGADL